MFDSLKILFKSKFGKDKHYYMMMKRLFGVTPNNIELYKLALIHKSASVVLDNGVSINNERLEYLGDAVIEAVVSDMLYVEYPYEDEGFLTKLRSKIVSRKSLNHLAEIIGLEHYVVSQSGIGSNRKHLYGDAFEAMVGAIYLDKGYNFVNRLLINRLFKNYLNLSLINETEADYKSRLIEWCQKNKKQFSIQTKQGDEYTHNNPQFVALVTVDGTDYGYGLGSSKKEAEQRASQNTMSELNISVI